MIPLLRKPSGFQTVSRIGIYLFAISLPVSHVPAQLGIALAVLGWLGEGIVRRTWQIRWNPVFIPLILYLVWNFISAAVSLRPSHSLAATIDNEWPLLMMLMLFWTLDSAEELVTIVSLYIAAATVAMVYAVWQTFGGMEFYRGMPLDPMGGFYRAVGFYGFYLTFAGFAMSIFFLSVSFLVELKARNRWRFILPATASFLAVVATFARSIWLSFLAAIPLFGFTRSRKFGILLTLSLLLLGSVGILTVPALRYRAESIVDLSQNETRLNLWKTAVRIAADHPVLGIGQDNWDHFFESYRVDGYYDSVVHPHNDYLNVLVASGYPGLAAFIVTWGLIVRRGFLLAQNSPDERVRAIALGGAFSIVGYLIGALFQNYYGTFVNCLGWWFLAGLIMAVDRIVAAAPGPSGGKGQSSKRTASSDESPPDADER